MVPSLFTSEADYENFPKTEKFTVGEHIGVLETHTWVNYKDEEVFCGFKEDYAVLLDDGVFNQCQLSLDATLYSGICIVG